MSTHAVDVYLSASRLEKEHRCPRLALHEDAHRSPPDMHMVAGITTHSAIELCWHRGHWPPTVQQLDDAWMERLPVDDPRGLVTPEKAAKVRTALAALAGKPDRWPDRGWVRSVEGDGLPSEFTTELPGGRPGFAVLGGEMDIAGKRVVWGLRGATDLVYVHPSMPHRLRARDWKSSDSNYPIQGKVYPAVMSIIFEGFTEYSFEPVFILSAAKVREFCFSLEPQPPTGVESMVSAMETVETLVKSTLTNGARGYAPARENKYCFRCPIKGDCKVYMMARAAKERAA